MHVQLRNTTRDTAATHMTEIDCRPHVIPVTWQVSEAFTRQRATRTVNNRNLRRYSRGDLVWETSGSRRLHWLILSASFFFKEDSVSRKGSFSATIFSPVSNTKKGVPEPPFPRKCAPGLNVTMWWGQEILYHSLRVGEHKVVLLQFLKESCALSKKGLP